MMYKILFLTLSVLLVSCAQKDKVNKYTLNKNIREQRIIYHVKKSVADAILKQFEYRLIAGETAYARLDLIKLDHNAIYVSTKNVDYYDFQLKHTNRFLQLNDSIFLPVLFEADNIYYKRTDGKLPGEIGGSKYFFFDENGEFVIMGVDM